MYMRLLLRGKRKNLEGKIETMAKRKALWLDKPRKGLFSCPFIPGFKKHDPREDTESQKPKRPSLRPQKDSPLLAPTIATTPSVLQTGIVSSVKPETCLKTLLVPKSPEVYE
jgi:hypothetical protein